MRSRIPLLTLLVGASLASLPLESRAQAPVANATVDRLAIVVAAGRVHVYPSSVPSDGEGWFISRDGVRLNTEPLTGVAGPQEFAAAVGADLDLLQRITGTESAVAAYRRLRLGGTAAGIAQVLSPRAAFALGALYVDSTARRGASHAYVAELVRLDRPDSVLRRARGTVPIIDMVVPVPGMPRASTADGVVALGWDAARFVGAADDIVVAFTVERADSAGPFVRITPQPLMRLADRLSGFRDESAIAGATYRYRVRAADLLGRLSVPGPAITVRAPAARGPNPPTVVATEPADGRIRLVWNTSPEPLTRGYHVERSVGGDSTFRRITRVLVPVDEPEFVDSLTRGREIYTYRVRAVDLDGRVGAPSNGTTARGLDLRPPAAPTALTLTPLPGRRVRLAWRATGDRDLRGYEVHRAERGDSTFARMTPVALTTTTFVDSGYGGTATGTTVLEAGLEPGREYTWRVVAIDSSANVSAPLEGRLRIVDDEAPEPVRGLDVRNHLGRYVEVSWTASPSLDVARYAVERVIAGSQPTLVATVGPQASFLVRDTTAIKGRPAAWRVIAVDSAGNLAQPVADTLTFRDITRPPAPRRVTAVRADGATMVRWERVVSLDFRGYVVYRAVRVDGPRTRLSTTPVTALEFLDRAPVPGAFYVVRAVDASGNESAESVAVQVVERP